MARRNPFGRFIPDPIDIAARPHPLEGGFQLPSSVRPGEFQNPDLLAQLPASLRDRVTGRIRGRSGRFLPYPFSIGVASFVLIPSQPSRFYLFIVNNSAANRVFVGFDYDPTANNGVILEANLGFYEPWIVPTNEIRIAAAAAGTNGIAFVATTDTE